jgi:hypothetical protein
VEDGASLHWTTVDLKVDVWHEIWNSGYKALWRKAEDESPKSQRRSRSLIEEGSEGSSI